MKISTHRKLLLAAALAGFAGASPAFGQGAATITLVPETAVWEYDFTSVEGLDSDRSYDDNDTPDDWASLSATDGGATPVPGHFSHSGRAPLGFGADAAVETDIDVQPGTPRPVTAYFRHVFTMPAGINPAMVKTVTLRLPKRLPGGCILRPGTPKPPPFSRGLPRTHITPHTFGIVEAATAAAEAEMTSVCLPPECLSPGENIIAVEVHRSSATDDDMRFACVLECSLVDPLEAVSATVSQNPPVVLRGAPVSLHCDVTGLPPDGSAVSFQWLCDNVEIPDATSPVLQIPACDGSDLGSYCCVVSAGDACKISDPHQLACEFPSEPTMVQLPDGTLEIIGTADDEMVTIAPNEAGYSVTLRSKRSEAELNLNAISRIVCDLGAGCDFLSCDLPLSPVSPPMGPCDFIGGGQGCDVFEAKNLDAAPVFRQWGWWKMVPLATVGRLTCGLGPELITNGNFEAGNVGFTSSYGLLTGICSPGRYNVADSFTAPPMCPGEWGGIDHTTGSPTGKFFVADGSQTPGVAAWRQTVAVTAGASYEFSAFVNNLDIPAVSRPDPTVEAVIIDASNVPTPLGSVTLPESPDVWVPMTASWTAPAVLNAPYRIEFRTTSTAFQGNNFAIDDISFRRCGANPMPGVPVHFTYNSMFGSTPVGTLVTNSFGWFFGGLTNVLSFTVPTATLTATTPACPGLTRTVPVQFFGSWAVGIYGTLCCPSCPSCVCPPRGMSLWLPFDEASGTTSANLEAPGFPASATGGTPQFLSGFVSNSRNFGTYAQRYEVPNYPGINPGTGDFSLDCWVRRNSPNNTMQAILDHRSMTPVGGLHGWHFGLSYGRLVLQLANGSYQNYASTGTVPADGAWHLAAVTVDRTTAAKTVRFYIDGNLVGTASSAAITGSVNATSSLMVGAGQIGGNIPFQGGVDEVEFFKGRVLAQSEIQSIYRAFYAGKCKCPRGWQTLRLRNTGWNVTNTSLLPFAAPDPNYSLLPSADATALPTVCAVHPLWLQNAISPLSQWIGPRADANGLVQLYKYTTTVDLTGLNPATAVISGRWSADDAGKIKLNGVPLTSGITPNGWAFQSWTPFTLSGFTAGVNTIEFEANNAGGGPTGIRVEMAGRALGCCDTRRTWQDVLLENGTAWASVPASLHAPTADADQDGYANELELGLGSNPLDSSSTNPPAFSVVPIAPVAGAPEVMEVRVARPADTAVELVCDATSDLTNWVPTEHVSSELQADGVTMIDTFRDTDPTGAVQGPKPRPKRFIRIRIKD